MYTKTRSWLVGALVLAVSSGCALQKKDDVDAFRDAVPKAEAVSVSGPEGAASGSTSTASTVPGPRTLATTPTGPYAKWYQFTRDMRDGVNHVTGGVLGTIWILIHTEPTSAQKDNATWGPYSDALDPVTYRFRITRTATDEYDYVFEGRPKASTDDADFRALLTGHGYGTPHPMHGQGTFTVNLDVAKSLDPASHPTDSGTVTIVHHFPHDFSENLSALPRTITATVTPAGEAHFSVESVANLDGTGSIHVDAHADIDDSKLTKLEDVVIDSRWRATGAGRSDISISGGDLPASTPLVNAVECWGTDFVRDYYSDSVNFSPSEGLASACAYGDP